MCGLFGLVANPGPRSREVKDTMERVFNSLAVMATERGTHSSGLVRVRAGAADLFKVTVPAWEAMQYEPWRERSRLTRDTFAILGHVRWATHGAITPGNAHPFRFTLGPRHYFVGAHNGVLVNHQALRVPGGPQFASDSKQLMALLARTPWDEYPEALRRIRGSAALTLATTTPSQVTVTLTRNEGNPLVWSTLHGMMVYASTVDILEAAVEAIGIKLDQKPESFSAQVGRTFVWTRQGRTRDWDRVKERWTWTGAPVAPVPVSPAATLFPVEAAVDLDFSPRTLWRLCAVCRDRLVQSGICHDCEREGATLSS